MAQHDMNIANAAGATVRADINNALAALVSRSSGSSAPSTTFAYMEWVDTTTGVKKRRNAANSAWLVDSTIDETLVLARASNTILGVSDKGKTVVATGTWSQTFTAAATLADGWYVDIRNDGSGAITLDPNSTEQIDGATTQVLAAGEGCRVVCNGSAFKTIGRLATSAAKWTTARKVNGVDLDGSADISLITNLASATSLSGTSVTISSIPATAKKITVMIDGMSSNGTSTPIIQLGVSGTPETSGYSGAQSSFQTTCGYAAMSAGIISGVGGVAAYTSSAIIEIWKPATGNIWWFKGDGFVGGANITYHIAGYKSLAGVLDSLFLTMTNGTDAFDGGTVTAIVE